LASSCNRSTREREESCRHLFRESEGGREEILVTESADCLYFEREEILVGETQFFGERQERVEGVSLTFIGFVNREERECRRERRLCLHRIKQTLWNSECARQ
jgi:hypothetical protein